MKLAERRSDAVPARETPYDQRGSQLRRTLASARNSRFGIFPVIGIVAAIVGWQLAAAAIADPLLLPAPLDVWRDFLDLATAPKGALSIWPQIEASLVRVSLGWGFGVVLGVFVGAIMGTSRIIHGLVYPVVELLRPIPALAYAPVMVVWFGIGETSKVLLLFATAFPVMLITTASAVGGVDESFGRAALTLGASRWYTLTRVIIPGALPQIFTAIRLSLGLTWATVVAAEFIAASKGLGWMILQASRYLDTATIFVGIAWIGILAFSTDALVRLIERRVVPWKGKS
jgi:taurine transport system permease protein